MKLILYYSRRRRHRSSSYSSRSRSRSSTRSPKRAQPLVSLTNAQQQSLQQAQQIFAEGKTIGEVFTLAALVPEADKESLLLLADRIKSQYPQHAVLLATVDVQSKITLINQAINQ